MKAQNITATGSIEGISSKSYVDNQTSQNQDPKLNVKHYLNQEILEHKLKYWQDKLANYEVLSLPLDNPRLKQTAFVSNMRHIELDITTSTRLRGLALQLNVSLDSILLSAYFLFLRSYANQDDIIVSTPFINQSVPKYTDGSNEFFLQNFSIRAKVNPDMEISQFIIRIDQDITGAKTNFDIPYLLFAERLNIASDVNASPFSRAIFGVQDFANEGINFALKSSVDFENLANQIDKADLALMFDNISEVSLSGMLNYASNLFSEETIAIFIKTYKLILGQFAELSQTQSNISDKLDHAQITTANINQEYQAMTVNVMASNLKSAIKIRDIYYLDAEDYEKVVYKWNATDKDYPAHKTIHQLFEEQVKKTPDNIAVIYEDTKLTYKELNQRANQLAHYLIDNYQIQPDDLIALCLERSEYMLIAILAVLKSGAAYVPIDPSYPEARMQYMLTDTAAKIILTNESLSWSLGFLNKSEDKFQKKSNSSSSSASRECVIRKSSINILPIDDQTFNQNLQQQKSTNPKTNVASNNLAYVIYTSGTTGKPKGVMVEHKGVVNRILWMNKIHRLSEEDKILQKASYAFDVSIWEMLWAIWYGASTRIAKQCKYNDVNYLIDTVEFNKISIVHFVPSMLNAFIDNLECRLNGSKEIVLPNLKYIFCSGEALNLFQVKKIHQILPDVQIHNLYGPTEASVDVLHSDCTNKNINSIYIGKPIYNTQSYLLNTNLIAIPIGGVGEVYLSGDGIARGYLNQTNLTQEKFIQNPFQTEVEKKQSKNAKLYKTGDLARYLSDGNLEFIDRNDLQIKLRGYRIELGEIENILNQFSGIKQSVVLALNNTNGSVIGDKYLVAYYVAKTKLDERSIFDYLSKQLPDYMLPTALVHLKQLPLTINGKLDRKALPPVELTSSSSYVAPINPVEIKLCEVYAEVLGLPASQIGVKHNFLQLGGNSILAINVIAKINANIYHLRDKLKITDILSNNIEAIYTIANDRLLIKDKTENYQPILMQNHDGSMNIPVTSMQKTILTHEYTTCNHLIYNEHILIEKLAKIDYNVFLKGCQVLLNQYPILSSNYRFDDATNKFIGFMPPSATGIIVKEINVTRKRDRNKILAKLLKQPFELDKDRLIRFYLVQYAKSSEIILIFHHVILDASSVINMLIPNLLNIMNNPKASNLISSELSNNGLNDYAIFQNKLNNYYKNQLAKPEITDYWKTKLEQADDLRFTSAVKSFNCTHGLTGKLKSFIIDSSITAELKQLAKQNHLSLFSLLYAAFNIVIGKYSRSDNICIETNIDERCLYPEHLHTLGHFINNSFILSELKSDMSLLEYSKSVQDAIYKLMNNLLNYDNLLKLNRDKVLQLSKIHFNIETEELKTEHKYLQTQIHGHSGHIKKELYFEMDAKQDTICARVEYANNIYSNWLIDSLITSYTNLLKQFTVNIDIQLAKVSLLSLEQYQQIVVDWNKTDKDYSAHKTIHQLFEEQVKKTPNNIAVVYENTKLTYRELNQRSNQLAHYLLNNYQIQPDDLIALYLERSEYMLIAILAVLKSGAAYVPIDPSYPEARVQYMLTDAAAKVILTNEALNISFLQKYESNINILLIDVEAFTQQLQQQKLNNPKTNVASNNLAYVIYTSGTTGKPKGVMIEHASIVNRIQWMNNKYPLKTEDKILQKTPYVFDVSVWELFWAIWYGASMVFAKPHKHKDNDYLIDTIEHNKISVIHLVPAMVNTFVESLGLKQKMAKKMLLNNLKYVFCSGEVLSLSQVKKIHKILPNVQVHNLYGPTETSVDVLYYSCSDKNLNSVNIGKSIDNVQLYILDNNLNPLPVGAIGELYLSGVSLARGYLNQINLTREKFILNQFKSEGKKQQEKNDRLYKTGDLVRMLPDGNLAYIGRSDSQVKLNGQRIELGEIESVLNTFSGVKQSVVLVANNKVVIGGDLTPNQYLVCYYVADSKLNEKNILNYLKNYLPNYMLPNGLVFLDKLPLAINGKLNKSELPKLEFKSIYTNLFLQDKTQLEICKIFADTLALPLDFIGISDDFFKIGVDSILAIKLVKEINKKLNTTLSTSAIFEYKNIVNLAANVDYNIRRGISYIAA
jgi:amino acid adenylation domain-containing protein